MEKNGINALVLSNTLRMEQVQAIKTEGVTITTQEAEEYCAFKKQKKTAEILSAMRKTTALSKGLMDVTGLCERALRLQMASVKTLPTVFLGYRDAFLRNGVRADCIVGGTGETFAKVKACETKCAVRLGAREISLVLTPSLIANCRYAELKKEVKKVKRATKKCVLKACVLGEYPRATLLRLGRLVSELGVQYFSIPYFPGCETFKTELGDGCLLEVTGVKTLEDFKRLTVAGVGRIVLSNAWELYVEWMREVENITLDTTNVVKAQTSNKETSAMAQKLQNFPRLAEVSSATEKKMGQAGTSRV